MLQSQMIDIERRCSIDRSSVQCCLDRGWHNSETGSGSTLTRANPHTNILYFQRGKVAKV
jgi:hypothetical protein